MDESKASSKGGGHWRGRLTVIGLFVLGLVAILVLHFGSRMVAPAHPPPAAVPAE